MKILNKAPNQVVPTSEVKSESAPAKEEVGGAMPSPNTAVPGNYHQNGYDSKMIGLLWVLKYVSISCLDLN